MLTNADIKRRLVIRTITLCRLVIRAITLFSAGASCILPGVEVHSSRRIVAVKRLIFTGLAVSVLASVVLGAAMWRDRNPDLSCMEAEISLNIRELGIDVQVPGGRTGEWNWWPTGLTCVYPQIGGGFVTVQPSPVLSMVLIAGGLGLGVAVGGGLLAIRRRPDVERASEQHLHF